MDRLKKNKITNVIFLLLCHTTVIITLVIVVGMCGYIGVKGLFSGGKIANGFNTHYFGSSSPLSGILWNTVVFLLLTLLLSVPLGLFSAIYLCFYAPKNGITYVIEASISTLQALPSIIFGLFGMLLFVNVLGFGYSLLSGVLTVTLMVLPTLIYASMAAIRRVNPALLEASIALGSTKSEAIFKVVLRDAAKGILSSVLLSTGRALGETAALLYTIGSSSEFITSVFSPSRTLSMNIYLALNEAKGLDEVYASAFILLISIIVINVGVHLIIKSIKEKK